VSVSSFLPWIFLILFVAVCGLAIWAFVVWWQRDHYTRQKFAFVGFSALIGLAALYLSSLWLEKSVLSLISHILFQPFGMDIPTSPLSPLEAVLFSVVFFALIYAYLEIFKHWDGQKTIAQHEQEQIKEPPSVLKDIALLFARDPKLQIYQADPETTTPILERPETLAWHQRARQLWTLKHRSYQFEDEYDPSYGWLGEERKMEALVLLACITDAPSKSEIQKLAEYAQRVIEHRKQTQFELILAVKNGTENKQGSRSYPLTYTSEAELLDDLVNFDDYFNDIHNRVKRDKLPGSDWTLQAMYTPSHYRIHQEKQPQTEEIEQFIFRWLAENTPRQLAVLGEYGQGKSTLSLLLCYQLIQLSKTDTTVRIPILIELRGKTLRTLQPEELLAIWAKNYHIDPQALLHLHLAGRLLLIFEGFDEIDLSGDTEARIAHFRTLWQLNYERAKIIITGRPNFFLDSQELRRALGDAEQSYTLHLEPFSIEQIRESLHPIASKIRNEIIVLSNRDNKFYEVVARPSLLYIVALLWEKEKLSERAHLNSADVIDLFIKHSLQRQQTKQDNRKFMVLNSAERLYFMMGIAAYMAAKQLQNQIDKLQLEEAVNLLVNAIPDEVSRQVNEPSGEDSRPLRSEQRLEWSKKHREIMEQIHTDVRSCGLLVTDLSKDGTFKFAHQSYMELLQARVLCSSFAVSELDKFSGQSIVNTWQLEISDIQHSDEAFSFSAELLKTHLQQSGVSEENAVAKKLWEILVVHKFSGYTRMNLLTEYWIISTSWLINQLIFWVDWAKLERGLFAFLEIEEPRILIPKLLAAKGGEGLLTSAIIGGIIVGATIVSPWIIGALVGGMIILVYILIFSIAITTITFLAIILVRSKEIIISIALGIINLLIYFLWDENPISNRLYLWYRACKSLNFSQESIEKVVGKGMAKLLAERAEKQEEK